MCENFGSEKDLFYPCEVAAKCAGDNSANFSVEESDGESFGGNGQR